MREAASFVGKQFGICRSPAQCSLGHTELQFRNHELFVSVSSELDFRLNNHPQLLLAHAHRVSSVGVCLYG